MNHYLENIKKDYEKYYDHVVKEKQQQYDALMLLKQYMGELITSENLVDDELRVAKHDEKYIIREMDKIRNELDEMLG